MATIKQGGVSFTVDANKNLVTKEMVVEKITSVPDSTLPETQRIVAVAGGKEKVSIGLFSAREEITLTGQCKYLGNVSFEKADFEDDVTEFTATVEYLIEAEAANSQAELRLYDFNAKSVISGSLVDSGVKAKGKYKLVSTTLTMPTDSIIECHGKKIAGSIGFLNATISIEKTRKA